MAAQSPVILILGAGSKVGFPVARAFASKGYKVALAARSIKESDSTDTQLNIPSDFSKPDDVANAFAKTKHVLGIPSVVVYNASTIHFTPADDPFAIAVDELASDNTVNVLSPFVAAQQAVAGFAQLPASTARTFIHTGNVLNVMPLPKFISQGIGKSGAAAMIWAAAEAYKDKGYKFYYADERKADGAPKYAIDGDAHADIFWELAQGEKQGPWHQTFVKGVGYQKFENTIS